MTTSDFERAVLERLAIGLHDRLRGVDDQSSDPDWVADAMLDALPTAHPYLDLGPFYDTAGLARWMKISRQAVHQKVSAHQILACATADGQKVYPAWQFTPDGRVIPGLAAVLKVLLPAAADAWTVAIWLTTPDEDYEQKTAIEWLLTSRDNSRVLTDARADAARWSH